ncbi:MAG TPA: anti-sigma factor antagonist [Candidatus Krumholzibacteria bacterium]|nr:anti-sigma factor antagonist [Candidatus Krumholzibacteria bacterium]
MARQSATVEKKFVRDLTVPADDSQLGRVRDFVIEVCDAAGFSTREISNTKLAIDEACTNIIKHAYDGNATPGNITVLAEVDSGRVRFRLQDQGKHFDFSGVKDPDLDQYVETGRKGGFGVFLINRLMDGVEYHATDNGNELVLTKRSQAALSASILPSRVPMRGTLRFKFMVRASGGLFVLVAVLWGFAMVRQTRDISSQRVSQWSEKRRLAENFASRSVSALLDPSEYSIESTNLSSDLARLAAANDDLAYAKVVDALGSIRASARIEEVFQSYQAPPGDKLLEDGRTVWTRHNEGDRAVRDIAVRVSVQGADGTPFDIGELHLGVYEDAVDAAVEDGRLQASLLLLVVFAVGVLLILGLVQVFVRPIQILTDGVRAIGDGNLEGKLDVRGPAEIGAIAGVFNEITEKFKKAQSSILEQEKMQKEIEVAKQIQQSLLPRRRPEISGYDIAPLYQAAAEVGGDYYDFVQVDDDTIGVVVADVSGKGVPGSLVMTMIRTALRMEARGNRNASDVMSKMNAFVTDDMKKGMFVTMFYVVLDSKNRVINYASAGHNPMILYRHETKETFFLNPKGFPVGISLPDESLFRRSISLEKIRLKKDDMLVIYTDGVTEAMNERREQYGEERLLEMVRNYGEMSPEQFIARLDADIRHFTAGYPQSDDITVVAVKEKMTADDVLYGIRKKLIDLVEVQGMSVKDACQQMRMSPATYYRYKRRLEVMGERGLRNDVLRDDVSLKRVSLEARKEIMRIIAANPEFGAKRITEEYNADRAENTRISERMVYEELKRLNLNTRELRLDYLRRNRLRDDDGEAVRGVVPAAGGTPSVVDDLLRSIPGISLPGAGQPEAGAPARGERDTTPPLDDVPARGDAMGVAASSSDGITEIRLNGHLDSASSAGVERRLRDLIASGAVRIIVDLADVSYVSSGGWGIFVGEVRGLRERGGDIVLTGMTPEVYDVYELLGFADVLRAFPSVAEARAFLSLPPEQRVSQPLPARDLSPDEVAAAHGITIDAGADDTPREWQSLRVEATTVGERGEIAVLLLGGIIDTVSAEKLRAAVDQIISNGRYKIVVDMSQVEYVSSGGWGVFTERLREVRRAGGDVKLFGMDPDVYYVFTMLGFNIVLSSFDILVDAIEDFSRPALAMGSGDTGDGPGPDAARAYAPAGRVSASVPGMDIVWEDGPERMRIARLAGIIETTAVSLLSDEISREVAAAPRALVFDLTGVEYISSSGWGQFARAHEAVGAVALSGLGSDLLEVYDCLEFRSFITAYASDGEAIAALSEVRSSAPQPLAPPPAPAAESVPDADAHLDGVDDVLSRPSPPDAIPARDDVPPAPPVAGRPSIQPQVRQDSSDDAPRPEPADEPMWGRRSWRSAAAPPDVDMSTARQDERVDRDEKLRSLGWEKYGKQLKKHASDDGHGRGNGEAEDTPEDGGGEGAA